MKKIFAITGISIIVLIIGAFLYLKFRKLEDFEPQIKAKLQRIIHDSSKGLYRLNIEKINADVVESKIILSNIDITYDSIVYVKLKEARQAPADVFNIHLNSLALDGLSPADIIKKKDIRLNILLIEKPDIHVFHHSLEYEKPGKGTSVYEVVRNELGSFGLNSLDLKDVDFVYHNVKSKVQTSFKNLNITLKDILIDKNTETDTTRFLYAKDASIRLKDFIHKTSDSLYVFKMDSITVLAEKNEVKIKNLHYMPRSSKINYPNAVKFRQDRYDIKISDLLLEDVSWWTLIAEEGLYINKANLSGGTIEVYSDRTIPLGKSLKSQYPHQLLFKSDFPLGIEQVKVRNIDITYEEKNPETMKRGQVEFYHTAATISNVTNIPSWVKKDNILKIDADTRFMRQGNLKAGFRFDLARQKEGVFSVYADMGPMSGLALNKATIALAGVEIKKAVVTRLKVNLNGNSVDASGKVLLTYYDLNVEVLKKQENGTLKKRGLITFIANNFKIHQRNPKQGEAAKSVDAYYKKPPEKSFFALIWKTILSGVKESAGI